MSIADDIAKALDLDAKATKGPWKAGRPDMLSYDGDGRGPWKQIYWDDPDADEHLGQKLPGVVGRMDGDNCIANAQTAAEYRDLAPRLARFAQQVMPLVEKIREVQALEEMARNQPCPSRAGAEYVIARNVMVDIALALNLEVPK